jgi:hypothetical protein
MLEKEFCDYTNVCGSSLLETGDLTQFTLERLLSEFQSRYSNIK